jgi:hypothetical protein
MLGDVLLRGPKLVGQLMHGDLAAAQPIKQPNPHRLGQEPKPTRDQLDQLIGNWRKHRTYSIQAHS